MVWPLCVYDNDQDGDGMQAVVLTEVLQYRISKKICKQS